MTVNRAPLAWGLFGATLAAGAAFAAAPGDAHKGPSELLFVAQLLLLILIGRLLGEAMLRLKQPAVMGQLIAGLMLGPSLFGALFPDIQHMVFPAAKEQKAMLDGIAQFGILMLLLLTGMETDLKLVRESGKASVMASLTGIVIPFLCGVALGEALPELHAARSRQTADHLAVPRHRAVDRLGQDRGNGDPRNEFHAPHRRPGHPRLGHHRRHRRLDDRRGDLQPGAARSRRRLERGAKRDRHAGLHGR